MEKLENTTAIISKTKILHLYNDASWTKQILRQLEKKWKKLAY